MTTAIQYITAAREYVGVPWQHQGRSEFGLDCIGLLICAAEDCGISVTSPRSYGREPTKGELASLIRHHCSLVPNGGFQAGDIIIMGVSQTHVGILTDSFDPFGLIHIPTNGVCCEVVFRPDICVLRGVFRPKDF